MLATSVGEQDVVLGPDNMLDAVDMFEASELNEEPLVELVSAS